MQGIDEQAKAIKECTICFDNIEEKIVTFPWGNNHNPVFMIVGESPSRNPNLPKNRNALLITPTGSMLTKALSILKIDHSNCYYTNVVKCAIEARIGNQMQCRAKWLANEMSSIKPKYIITLGKPAREAVIDLKWRVESEPKIYHLVHPSFAMKSRDGEAMFWGGVNKIKEELYGRQESEQPF